VALAQKIAARLKVMPEGEAHVAHAIAVCEEQRELGLSPLFYLAGRPSLYHSRPGFVPGLSFSELIVSFSSLPRGRADVRAAISGSGIFLPAPKGPVPRSGCPLNRDLTGSPAQVHGGVTTLRSPRWREFCWQRTRVAVYPACRLKEVAPARNHGYNGVDL
jgi:hypothetical protein